MISASSLYYVVLGYKLVFPLLLQLDYISNFPCSYAEILLASGKGTYCLFFFFLCIFLRLEGVDYCRQFLGWNEEMQDMYVVMSVILFCNKMDSSCIPHRARFMSKLMSVLQRFSYYVSIQETCVTEAMNRWCLFCICWLGNFDEAMFFWNSWWVLTSTVPQKTINDFSSAAHCMLATSLENLRLTLLNVLSYQTSFRMNSRFINHLILFVHSRFAAKSI